MNHDVMKLKITFVYNQCLDYWYMLLGEFFENTKGFTQPFTKRYTLGNIKTEITWANDSWNIKEI